MKTLRLLAAMTAITLSLSVLADEQHFVLTNEIKFGTNMPTSVDHERSIITGNMTPWEPQFLTVPAEAVPQRAPQAGGQTAASEGTEFWVSFMTNYDNDGISLSLIASAREATTVTVKNPRTGWKTTFNISANGMAEKTIPAEQALYDFTSFSNTSEFDKTYDKGIIVTSTKPITLYSSNYMKYSYDASIVFPTTSLGYNYIVQTYTGSTPEIAIIATEDNTMIQITPSEDTYNKINGGQTKSKKLEKGQVYNVVSSAGEDLSGTIITSNNKKIAVLAGNRCVTVPKGVDACDHIYEQMLPTETWGQNFVVTKSGNQSTDRVRITALESETTITIDGTKVTTLSAKKTYEYTLTKKASYITTSGPCCCFLYIEGGENNRSIGDPSSIMICPIEQRIHDAIFRTFPTVQSSMTHYANIIVPTNGVANMMLDGENISNKFIKVPSNPDYSYAIIDKISTTKAHTLSNSTEGFMAHVYGLAEYESYGYVLGMNTFNLTAKIKVNGEASNLSTGGTTLCHSLDPITFEPEVSHDYLTADWDMGDGTTYTDQKTVQHTYTKAGEYIVSLTVKYINEITGQEEQLSVETKVVLTIDKIQETLYLCEGSSMTWHGQTLSEPGTYTSHVDAGIGICESEATLYLKSAKNYLFEETLHRCEGAAHKWRGQTIDHEGEYYDNYTSVHGCDSIYKLTVVAAPSHLTPISAEVCAGGAYVLGSQILKESGVYHDTLSTIYGCDSIIELTLKVLEPIRVQQTEYICSKEQYYWEGQYLRESGNYSVLYENAMGCDSIIELELTVLNLPENAEAVAPVCADEDGFYISVYPETDVETYYTLRFDSLALATGFKEIEHALLQDNTIYVPLPASSHESYAMPNNYVATVTIESNQCNIAKLFPIPFTIQYPSWIIRQKWDNVLGVLNEGYNGGYQFSAIQWYKNGLPISGETSDLYYQKDAFADDEYQVLLTRASDGVSIMSCAQGVQGAAAPLSAPEKVEISSSIASIANPHVTLTATCDGSYIIYNSQGLVSGQGTTQAGESQQLTLPAQDGMYFVRFHSESLDQSFRVLIH